jgi:hypothetical protein
MARPTRVLSGLSPEIMCTPRHHSQIAIRGRWAAPISARTRRRNSIAIDRRYRPEVERGIGTRQGRLFASFTVSFSRTVISCFPFMASSATTRASRRAACPISTFQPSIKRPHRHITEQREDYGFRRDAVELHMQFRFEHEMGTIRLRFLVEDPDALCSEYQQRGIECTANGFRDTPWGTRELALYDLDRNALTFYRGLTRAENGRKPS